MTDILLGLVAALAGAGLFLSPDEDSRLCTFLYLYRKVRKPVSYDYENDFPSISNSNSSYDNHISSFFVSYSSYDNDNLHKKRSHISYVDVILVMKATRDAVIFENTDSLSWAANEMKNAGLFGPATGLLYIISLPNFKDFLHGSITFSTMHKIIGKVLVFLRMDSFLKVCYYNGVIRKKQKQDPLEILTFHLEDGPMKSFGVPHK